MREDRSAALACGDGNDNILYSKHISCTDCLIDENTLWFANNTFYLPSEH